MSLAEFLLARIAEDEAVARAALEDAFVTQGDWEVRGPGTDDPNSYYVMTEQRCDVTGQDAMMAFATADHVAHHDPARVLAECAAKRAIIEHYEDAFAASAPAWRLRADRHMQLDRAKDLERLALRPLAAVYANHRDYLQEWKP